MRRHRRAWRDGSVRHHTWRQEVMPPAVTQRHQQRVTGVTPLRDGPGRELRVTPDDGPELMYGRTQRAANQAPELLYVRDYPTGAESAANKRAGRLPRDSFKSRIALMSLLRSDWLSSA